MWMRTPSIFHCLISWIIVFKVALGYTEKYGADKVRVLTLVKNRGKGGAVRMVIVPYLLCVYLCAILQYILLYYCCDTCGISIDIKTNFDSHVHPSFMCKNAMQVINTDMDTSCSFEQITFCI